MNQTQQAGPASRRSTALFLVLLVSGALNLAYALAGGMSRSADAMQGFGLLLVSAAALFIASPKLQANLATTGRASLPGILLTLGGVALLAGIVLSWV